MPLVVMGFGADRPWRVRSWDRFVVPHPFSRVRVVLGPPMHFAPDLERDQIEECSKGVERLLNDLTTEAEAWAESGTRKVGEVPIRPQFAAKPIPVKKIRRSRDEKLALINEAA
jgi:hypothetical protein